MHPGRAVGRTQGIVRIHWTVTLRILAYYAGGQMARIAPRVLAVTCALVAILATMLVPAPTSAQSGTVTMQWLGWSHYRFTSPTGKILLTNPFVANPDSP